MRQPARQLRNMLITALAVLSALPAPSRADIYVIANAAMTVGADDIKLIYTGDKEFIGPIKVKPLDNHAAQSEFLGKVLQLNANRYDSLWTMKCFRDGLSAPVAKANDGEVIAYVQSTPGAIGYITVAPPPGVTVLKKF